MKHTVYLSLGTNLGDRRANLRAAIQALAPAVHVIAESPVYRTAPWGHPDQPEFLNQAVEAETPLAPLALLAHLKKIEIHLGRQETFRYGPRVIDLDILLYNDLVLDTPALTIPHPSLHMRSFVLVPLADLAPELVHPVLGEPIYALLAAVDTAGVEIFTPGPARDGDENP